MMGVIPLLATTNIYWFLVPLVLAISLVFSATRHEHWQPIFSGAMRLATWSLVLLGIVFLVLLGASWWN